jgi:hypothetical protein
MIELTPEQLREEVERRVKLARSTTPTGSSDLLVRQPQVMAWGNNKPLAKDLLIKEFVKYKPAMGRKQDEKCMGKYLDKVMKTGLQDPGLTPRNQFLPEGAPLLDWLAVRQESMDAWKYPAREEVCRYERTRGLTYQILQEVEVQEIVVGRSSKEKIEEVVKFFWANWEADQHSYPSQVVSLDTEQVQITLYDVYRMNGKLPCPEPRIRSHKPQEIRHPNLEIDDRPIQAPAKIMVGNGFNYAVMISIDWDLDENEDYLINPIQVQPEIIEFLQSIPIGIGLAVGNDISEIDWFFSELSGEQVYMQGFIDIGALAVLCGYELNSLQMTTVAVQVWGTIMNKMVSTGDDKWGLRWKEIPASLQVYALGDLRFGHVSYLVLSALLLSDTMPDPEIACMFFDKNQFNVVRWFSEWVKISLDGVEVDYTATSSAVNRQELISTLRYRNPITDRLHPEPPAKIKVWKKLVGSWPNTTSGGCRYILQARMKFLEQMQILGELKIYWLDGFQIPEITPEFIEYARFGISRRNLARADWCEPTPNTSNFEMTRPARLSPKLIEMDPAKIKSSAIQRFCIQEERDQKLMILEWARMYPNRIVEFLMRMEKDEMYKMFFKPLYDSLRLIFHRLMNRPTIELSEMNEDIGRNILNQLEKQRRNLERSDAENKAYRERVEYLTRLASSDDTVERARWRDRMPQLPPWKLKKRGEKRKKKDSCSSTGAKKQKGDGSLDTPVDPTMSEPEEDLAILAEEINAEKPRFKKVLSSTRKKTKKKKTTNKSKISTQQVCQLLSIENYEYPGKDHAESDAELEIHFNERFESEDPKDGNDKE